MSRCIVCGGRHGPMTAVWKTTKDGSKVGGKPLFVHPGERDNLPGFTITKASRITVKGAYSNMAKPLESRPIGWLAKRKARMEALLKKKGASAKPPAVAEK